VTVKQTGENEQQLETVAFLGKALIIALMLILFTLVLQFNSISKSVIILTEISQKKNIPVSPRKHLTLKPPA